MARLQDSTPAHKALQSHVDLSLGRLPHPSWSRQPGRPRGRWIKSQTTRARHLPTSGDRPLDAVIVDERRAHAGYAMMIMNVSDVFVNCHSHSYYLLHVRWVTNYGEWITSSNHNLLNASAECWQRWHLLTEAWHGNSVHSAYLHDRTLQWHIAIQHIVCHKRNSLKWS